MALKNKLAAGVAALATTAVVASPAAAQTVGQIATGLTSQVTSINTLISVVIFVAGLAVAAMGLLKFKAHSANPNDPSNKLSSAWVLIFVGAAMVAIPAVLGSGISTIFGTGADKTTANTGFGNSID